MEKLVHFLPNLLNAEIEVDGLRGTIINVVGTAGVCVRLANGADRRLPAMCALNAVFSLLRDSKTSGTPEAAKSMAVSCLQQMQKHKRQLAQLNRNRIAMNKRRHRLNARIGAISEDLKGGHKRKMKLKKKLKALDNQDKENSAAIGALRRESTSVFRDWQDLLTFFRMHGFGFSKTSLVRWAKGECLGSPGCPTAFTEAEEQMLLDTLLARDDMGMPMSREDVCEMAWRFASEGTIRRFGGKMPGEH